jgi:hypothetical protein
MSSLRDCDAGFIFSPVQQSYHPFGIDVWVTIKTRRVGIFITSEQWQSKPRRGDTVNQENSWCLGK